MFESTGTINEEVLKKIKKYLMPPKQKITFILLTSFSLIMSILLLIIISPLYSLYFFLVFIVLFMEYFYTINKYYKINIKRIEEITGKREIMYKSSFNEDGIILNNLATNSQGTIKYNSFKSCHELSNEFVILTKADQYIVVFKDTWTNEKIIEFKNFLISKCTNLKIK